MTSYNTKDSKQQNKLYDEESLTPYEKSTTVDVTEQSQSDYDDGTFVQEHQHQEREQEQEEGFEVEKDHHSCKGLLFGLFFLWGIIGAWVIIAVS